LATATGRDRKTGFGPNPDSPDCIRESRSETTDSFSSKSDFNDDTGSDTGAKETRPEDPANGRVPELRPI
jgi:hypothetical protein